MFVLFAAPVGILAVSLIVTLLRIMHMTGEMDLLRNELEALDQLLERRHERIVDLIKLNDKLEHRQAELEACDRVMTDQVENAIRSKAAIERKLTQVRVDSTNALKQFASLLQDIFGSDTCKSLEERLRNAFAKNGITEV